MQNTEIVGLDGARSGKAGPQGILSWVLGFSVQTERLSQTHGLPSTSEMKPVPGRRELRF